MQPGILRHHVNGSALSDVPLPEALVEPMPFFSLPIFATIPPIISPPRMRGGVEMNPVYRLPGSLGFHRLSLVILTVMLLLFLIIPQLQAHDIQSGLRQPYTGSSCCSDDDCAPAKEDVIANPDGSYTLPARGVTVQKSRVLPSPDRRYHICAPSIFPWHDMPSGSADIMTGRYRRHRSSVD
jgi:hypothetical protein